ncbi:MAG: type II toxin-antitoxin system Phd/YefM family antitoxin [Deltaproteobacteria bacterium]|nr:type II toxin-antitoxin system Phd/YefM family antitoxin [Deltaproteobacteria bacterium]
MRKVNALFLRNRLGQVLDQLERDSEPVLVSKGRKVRAVLVTLEDFKARFLDKQAEEERKLLLERIRGLRSEAPLSKSSLDMLRELRGYGS